MEKQKRWQFYLIVAVLVLTLYNILPTIFYYSNPLRDPIDAVRAKNVAEGVVHRVNSLEASSKDWLYSFSNLVDVSPTSIELQPNNPGIFEVTFASNQEAAKFTRFLQRAGERIPFVPAQLEVFPGTPKDSNKVLVSRQVSVHLDPTQVSSLFSFIPKYENGQISQAYRDLVYDRVTQLALAFGGSSKISKQADQDLNNDDVAISIAREIVDMDKSFVKSPSTLRRFYASVNQSNSENATQKLVSRLETTKTRLAAQKDTQTQEQKKLVDGGVSLDPSQKQQLALTSGNLQAVENALTLLKKNESKTALKPLTEQNVQSLISKSKTEGQQQVVSLDGHNPFVEALIIDWNSDKILIKLYDDLQQVRLSESTSEATAVLKEKINQYASNEISRAGRLADETVAPYNDEFAVSISELPSADSFLAMNLGYVASMKNNELIGSLASAWNPQHPDLVTENYPVRGYEAYSKEKTEDKKVGLVVYAPSMYTEMPPQGFRKGSIYVIAKGLDSVIHKFRETPDAPETKVLASDLNNLKSLMANMNFIGYKGSDYGMGSEFAKDYIFELDDYYTSLVAASREAFEVKGSKRYAILPFTDVEQRIMALNKIDDRTQEDLLKWKEEYDTAQVDITGSNRYFIPEPTANPYWTNFKINFAKYFRGDDRKILKWGLDLSGGKTVRIGLVDRNGQTVTNPEDIRQAQNELYTRINKMGVAERTIRIENNNIILEFPGSQALSASELVKASAMYFHVVNEKFGPISPGYPSTQLQSTADQFLQEVWNEAVVTNRKDVDSINEIAWNRLGADTPEDKETRPMSENARVLYESGLRLGNPREKNMSNAFNDSISSIAVIRQSDTNLMGNRTHPLVFIFNNYALEGASLNDVHAGYDAAQGNTLSFGVKKSYEGSENRGGSPRDDLYTWTSQFAEDKIAGTPKEAYSHGKGWRMGVILNGNLVSMPSLNGALRDNGTISGRFTQREISQLSADLKAGSLTFTPRILSEQNVSAELGSEERTRGIVASIVAVALVVVAMVGYYRFAGVVASVAVLLNILIMWGVLQNIEAALTLPGIAGIVLTIGMAVDANVLVFERVREEFKISGRIASAIQAGYRKAFSAIVDSNITTIIAALILIQFDSGPIKGFAVTLIIGIISSMFTSLFMTRYFFAGWVQNPANKSLNMSQFIGNTHYNFLGTARKAVIISVIMTVLGTYALIAQRKSIFGMDFTGGYSVNVELVEKAGTNYRVAAADALMAQGATPTDFQIRQLTHPNQLKIQMGISMDQLGKPFYQMPENLNQDKLTYEYQQNPRLNWIVTALEKGNLQIVPSELTDIQNNWTNMSGQFSDSMRFNAIVGLAIALLSILIYITFRFEFNFAVAAVVGLAHDVVITLGILAILHWIGLPVQIDLQVVGAIMTIIGYSLNDTIIVFDRIREDLKLMRKMSYYEVINHALNVTLSRTIMTSGTTLLVLLTLVLLGGQSIFAFSLVMTIGVLVGTLSSLFIAAPVLLWLHNRDEQSELSPRKV